MLSEPDSNASMQLHGHGVSSIMRTFNACCEGLFQLDHKASITQLLKHAELPWWFHVVALYKEGRLSPKHDQNQKSSHRMKRGNTTKTVPFLSMRWIETRCLCPDFGLILRLTGLNILAAVWASGPTCLNPPPVMNLTPRIFCYFLTILLISYDLLWSLMISYELQYMMSFWCHCAKIMPWCPSNFASKIGRCDIYQATVP